MSGLGTRWAMGGALRAPPEPRGTGFHAKGRQLIAGKALFGGQVVETKGCML